jgi:hypothetical protein
VDILLVGGAFCAVLFAPQLGWDRGPGYVFFSTRDFGPGPSEKGSGRVITENRQVAGIESIEISFPAEVIIRQGEVESVTIEAEDNVVANIDTQVVNGMLKIERMRGAPVWVINSRPVEITVVVKDLSELDFGGAGSVKLEALNTDHLKVTMDGAGSLELNQLQVKTLQIKMSGVGNLTVGGSADSLSVSMDGLGSFNAGNLHCKTADVSLNGLGNVTVWVDEDLTVDMNGLGSVGYFGGAHLHKTGDGLGSVKFLGAK